MNYILKDNFAVPVPSQWPHTAGMRKEEELRSNTLLKKSDQLDGLIVPDKGRILDVANSVQVTVQCFFEFFKKVETLGQQHNIY